MMVMVPCCFGSHGTGICQEQPPTSVTTVNNRFEPLEVTDDPAPEDVNIYMLESVNPEINVVDVPDYTPMEVVLDSGAADHVIGTQSAPNHPVRESASSKAGLGFKTASGNHIPNRGEMELTMKLNDLPVKSVFQVSDITKPLMSVGRLCDNGHNVNFTKDGAKVTIKGTNKELFFARKAGGLYVGEFMVKKSDSTFPRPAR